MGNRGNVYIHAGDHSGIYLYTHYSGSSLPAIVAAALDRGKDRWSDFPYLVRIVFSQLLLGSSDDADLADAGSRLFGTTGFGIDTQMGDGDSQIVDIDVDHLTVSLTEALGGGSRVSFDAFIAAHKAK
jgi:hypothetical protein